MKPKVSIVMPVLNGQRFIAEAIESIVAQTYDCYELLVVDDGSTDATMQAVQSFARKLDLKYIHHDKPHGIARSMNDGVRNATGDMIAFLDHDDAWFPKFLETQVSYLTEHPDVGMVHSDFQTIDAVGNVIEESVAVCRKRKRSSGNVFRELLLDSFIVGNSVLIRKECFTRLGLFDESLRWGDYHMWMRIAKNYKVDYVPEVLTVYRQHSLQSTRSVPSRQWAEQEPVGVQAIQKILAEYPEIRREIGDRAISRRMGQLYFEMAYTWFFKCGFANARSCLSKAIRLSPGKARYYILYAACLLRPAPAMKFRSAWHRARRMGSLAR